MALQELNIGAIWWADQTAKGSPASTADKKGRWVSGNLAGNVALGEEPYIEGSRFPSVARYPDRLEGTGEPGIQGQTGTTGHLLACFLGSDVVTGTGPYVHTIEPAGSSKYMTFWISVGSAVKKIRRHSDCRVSQLAIAGSTDNKVVRVTPTVSILDPDEVVTSDPVKTLDTTEPLLYTEGASSFTVNSVVYDVHSSFSIEMSDGLEYAYGDKITAADVAPTSGALNLSVTLHLNAAVQSLLNTLKYGTASPTAGTKPQQSAPAQGTYSFNIARGSTEALTVNVAGVSWNVPDEPDPSPGGGVPTVTLTGRASKNGVNPLITFTVKNADATSYLA